MDSAVVQAASPRARSAASGVAAVIDASDEANRAAAPIPESACPTYRACTETPIAQTV